MKERLCPSCKTTKAISEYNKDKQNAHGFATYCRDCQKKKKADARLTEWERFQKYGHL